MALRCCCQQCSTTCQLPLECPLEIKQATAYNSNEHTERVIEAAIIQQVVLYCGLRTGRANVAIPAFCVSQCAFTAIGGGGHSIAGCQEGGVPIIAAVVAITFVGCAAHSDRPFLTFFDQKPFPGPDDVVADEVVELRVKQHQAHRQCCVCVVVCAAARGDRKRKGDEQAGPPSKRRKARQ
ncbi:unnamed protein product [Vitrella brassicaformis CCMP3155]|uniref:Uncharacterized protein n=1 Tax=Vitrella brassicaformis (strain CCMP3155) TaxID=1169540 RepID=A0A0G4ERC0_VITBC|nr:unnamed protein product [Vitrella brassicaformis CCMP3155]|eukprot:CEM00813.1 unnamed protein product [Vitrella brassicaformis CCMP3155]